MLCNMLQGPDGLKRSHIQIRIRFIHWHRKSICVPINTS